MNRRIIVMVLAGVIGSSGVALGQEAKPSRTINLVYDDSGSRGVRMWIRGAKRNMRSKSWRRC